MRPGIICRGTYLPIWNNIFTIHTAKTPLEKNPRNFDVFVFNTHNNVQKIIYIQLRYQILKLTS